MAQGRRSGVARLSIILVASLLALITASCGGGRSFPLATVPAGAGNPPSVSPQPIAAVEALGGRTFDRPIEFGPYPGERFFVAEQTGTVRLFDGDGGGDLLLLDLSDRISLDGNEEGLLSVALDPGFASNSHLWVYYSQPEPKRSVLSRFTVIDETAEPSSELIVLQIEQPFRNHNGGAIRFGPDGMLYLGIGDGGSHHDPNGSGQDRSTLLGSIVRLDVRDATPASPYVVSSDNPFVDQGDDLRPEIWAYGFRNPWRMSFDPTTGELWVGDVGEEDREEVDVVRPGQNYGWDIIEGDRCHEPAEDCDPTGIAFPVVTYDHSNDRCAITGGVVYRGSAVPEISGNFLYTDLCSGELWAFPADGSGSPEVVLDRQIRRTVSFGVDPAGEVYLLRFNRSILRLTSP